MDEFWSAFFTWSGWIIGLLGTAISIYQWIRAEQHKRRLQTVEWGEIHAATAYLARKLRADGVPAVFLATDARGGILARLVEERFHSGAPILIGFCNSREDNESGESVAGFSKIDTPKWSYFVPEKVLEFKERLIVLVDDATFTGQSLVAIKDWLVRNGASNVRSCTLLASEVSIKQRLSADYFWSPTALTEIVFPWGRMR